MNHPLAAPVAGIVLTSSSESGLAQDLAQLGRTLERLGLAQHVAIQPATRVPDPTGRSATAWGAAVRLRDDSARQLAPQANTLELASRLGVDANASDTALEAEIVAALLCSPLEFAYPGVAEFLAAVRIRGHIVRAGRRTVLAFDTEQAERPWEYWQYAEDTGFTLRPGCSLVQALQAATQPPPGVLYSFSCYRATEYVILLGISQELAQHHPALYQQLEERWRRRAIMSGPFHDVFLREYGTLEQPLPPAYYVPGDRVWFRNPDPVSSDVEGYEGSWVMYLGQGLYTNFWKPDQPYTLLHKCVEIYHWRHAVRTDASGKPIAIDEAIVEQRVRETLAQPAELEQVLARMCRLRDGPGVYASGGCIDATREHPRWVCPGTTDLVVPPG